MAKVAKAANPKTGKTGKKAEEAEEAKEAKEAKPATPTCRTCGEEEDMYACEACGATYCDAHNAMSRCECGCVTFCEDCSDEKDKYMYDHNGGLCNYHKGACAAWACSFEGCEGMENCNDCGEPACDEHRMDGGKCLFCTEQDAEEAEGEDADEAEGEEGDVAEG